MVTFMQKKSTDFRMAKLDILIFGPGPGLQLAVGTVGGNGKRFPFCSCRSAGVPPHIACSPSRSEGAGLAAGA